MHNSVLKIVICPIKQANRSNHMFLQNYLSSNVRKRTFEHVRPAKNQFSFTGRILDSQGCIVSSCGQQRLIGLRGCVGAYVRRYVFSRGGSGMFHHIHGILSSDNNIRGISKDDN